MTILVLHILVVCSFQTWLNSSFEREHFYSFKVDLPQVGYAAFLQIIRQNSRKLQAFGFSLSARLLLVALARRSLRPRGAAIAHCRTVRRTDDLLTIRHRLLRLSSVRALTWLRIARLLLFSRTLAIRCAESRRHFSPLHGWPAKRPFAAALAVLDRYCWPAHCFFACILQMYTIFAFQTPVNFRTAVAKLS